VRVRTCGVDIAAGTDHHHGLAAHVDLARQHGGQRDRAARLDHQLQVEEGALHGRQNLVVGDRDRALEQLAVHLEGDLAGHGRHQRVADGGILGIVGNALAERKRARGVVQPRRFRAVDEGVRQILLHGQRTARDQAAAAAGRDDDVRRDAQFLGLLDQLQSGRALARDHIRVVVGLHQGQAAFGRDALADLLAAFLEAVVQHDLAAQRLLVDLRQVFGGIGFEFLQEHTLRIDFAQDLPVGGAGDADPDGHAGAVAGQADHPNVMAEILPAELRADAGLAGELQDFFLEAPVPEGLAVLVALARQAVEIAAACELHGLQIHFGRGAADHQR